MRLCVVFLMAMAVTVTSTSAFNLDPALIQTVTSMLNTAVNEEGQVDIRGRIIKYKAVGRVHSLKEPWVYDGTAWDVYSGLSEKARHFKGKEGAIKAATLKLLERLKREGILKEEL